MKIGNLNKQRVLFGMLFGVLAANAAWFQQVGTTTTGASFSSFDAQLDISTGNKINRIVKYKKTIGKESTIEEAKYYFQLVEKPIPGYKDILTGKTNEASSGVAVIISRESCPGCTEQITEAMPREKAAQIKSALVQLAQQKIDEMADRDLKAQEKQVEIEKKNKKEEERLAKLEKRREKCEIGEDDEKERKGADKLLCLAGKIPAIDDPAKRAEAFAAIQLQLRDILVRGSEADKMKAREALTQLGSVDNGPEVFQAARAMLAGEQFENQTEKILSKMSRTRRGSQQFNQYAQQLQKLASKMDTNLRLAAEKAGSSATANSIGEADFWTDRLNENMSIALNGRASEALRNLQGRDSISGGYRVSGDLDELDQDGRNTNDRLSARRRSVMNSRGGGFDEGDRYTSRPMNRGGAQRFSARGGVQNRRGVPAYAQSRYNGRSDYDYDLDEGDYLEFPEDYGYDRGYYPSNARRGSAANGRYSRSRGRF